MSRGGGDLVDEAMGGRVRPPDEVDAGGRVREEEDVAWGEIGDVALLNRLGRESKYSSKSSKNATCRLLVSPVVRVSISQKQPTLSAPSVSKSCAGMPRTYLRMSCWRT